MIAMNSERGILIGIDLGGTNVRAGALTGDGRLLHWKDAPIEAARGPAAGLQTITRLVDEVIAQAGQPVLALGVGSTGPLDRQRGCIQNPYTLPGWEDVDIVTPLRERFGVPVALENDADAAALGEAWAGSGRGVKRMVMLTIGTGVGYALILDGEIYRGLVGEHPEGGHIPIDPSGPECYCGARGCLESLVSGPAIVRLALESDLASESEFLRTSLVTSNRIDAAMIFAGARQGDSHCQQLVDRIAEYIALGLVSIMMLILPDVIVLTGGVLKSFDLLEERMRASLARHDVIIPARQVKIQLAKLGQQAGLFGAARAAHLLVLESNQ
jgi:glucokinase